MYKLWKEKLSKKSISHGVKSKARQGIDVCHLCNQCREAHFAGAWRHALGKREQRSAICS